MKNRIAALDVVKAIAIYLVILGHVLQHLRSSNYIDEPVYIFIYSFHMSLFMTLSGFFAATTLKMHFFRLAWKKAKSLLLPCIVWGGVLSVCYQLFIEKAFSFYSLIEFIYYDFWFLKSVFICYILAWIGFSLKLPSWVWCFLVCVAAQFIPAFSVPVMMPCFLSGYILSSEIENVWFVRLMPFFLVVFVLLFISAPNSLFDGNFEKDLLSMGMTFSSICQLLICRFYKVMMGLSGSFFIISVIKLTIWGKKAEDSVVIHYLSIIGKETMGIYIVHSIIIGYIFSKFFNLDTFNMVILNVLVAPMFAFATLLLSYSIVKILTKSKIMSLLLLGK